jgi:hypothetical protein
MFLWAITCRPKQHRPSPTAETGEVLPMAREAAAPAVIRRTGSAHESGRSARADMAVGELI